MGISGLGCQKILSAVISLSVPVPHRILRALAEYTHILP